MATLQAHGETIAKLQKVVEGTRYTLAFCADGKILRKLDYRFDTADKFSDSYKLWKKVKRTPFDGAQEIRAILDHVIASYKVNGWETA